MFDGRASEISTFASWAFPEVLLLQLQLMAAVEPLKTDFT
jgi:hypothetical protein